MVSRWALGACVLQLVLAAAVGEVFPISRYTMYASLAPHDRFAVPLVLANGEPAEISDYRDFEGIDLARWTPPEPCSLGYVLDDVRRWVESHPGRGGDAEISLGFVVVVVRDGTTSEQRVIQQTGHAVHR